MYMGRPLAGAAAILVVFYYRAPYLYARHRATTARHRATTARHRATTARHRATTAWIGAPHQPGPPALALAPNIPYSSRGAGVFLSSDDLVRPRDASSRYNPAALELMGALRSSLVLHLEECTREAEERRGAHCDAQLLPRHHASHHTAAPLIARHHARRATGPLPRQQGTWQDATLLALVAGRACAMPMIS